MSVRPELVKGAEQKPGKKKAQRALESKPQAAGRKPRELAVETKPDCLQFVAILIHGSCRWVTIP